MNAAVGKLPGNARLRGIIPPAHAGIVGIGRIGVKAVRELHDDQPDLAKVSTRHHAAHVAHQRIARIAIIDGADGTGARRSGHDVLRLVDGHRHGLLAQHVDACLEKSLGDGIVC